MSKKSDDDHNVVIDELSKALTGKETKTEPIKTSETDVKAKKQSKKESKSDSKKSSKSDSKELIKLEEEVEKHSKLSSELKEQNKTLQNKIDEMDERVVFAKETSKSLVKLKEEFDTVNKEKDSVIELHAKLEESVEAKIMELNNSKDELSKLRSTIEENKSLLSEEREKSKALQVSLDKKDTTLKDTEVQVNLEELSQLKEEKNQLKEELKTKEMNITELTSNVSKLTTKIEDFEKNIGNQEKQTDEYFEKVRAEFDTKTTELLEQISQFETKVDEKNKENNKLLQKIAEFEKSDEKNIDVAPLAAYPHDPMTSSILAASADYDKKGKKFTIPEASDESLREVIDSSRLAQNIVAIVTANKSIKLKFLAMQMGMSTSRCEEDIQKLEAAGFLEVEYARSGDSNPVLKLIV